jgi:hypothetical protein
MKLCIEKKRPELWFNDWILHLDNAPVHKALSSSFGPKKSITEVEHPPYSPDLALNDAQLFPIKSALKGQRCQDSEDIQKSDDSAESCTATLTAWCKIFFEKLKAAQLVKQ